MLENLDIRWLINKFFMEHPEYEVEYDSDEDYEPDPNYHTDTDSELDYDSE